VLQANLTKGSKAGELSKSVDFRDPLSKFSRGCDDPATGNLRNDDRFELRTIPPLISYPCTAPNAISYPGSPELAATLSSAGSLVIFITSTHPNPGAFREGLRFLQYELWREHPFVAVDQLPGLQRIRESSGRVER